MPIKTDVKQLGSACVVAVSGKVTLGEAAQALRAMLEELLNQGKNQIVLNLAQVPFIDSAGLGVLALNSSSLKAAGGMLTVAEPQQRVEAALKLVRLNGVMGLYATEREAVESFGK